MSESATCHWKPVFSNHSILSGERPERGFIPTWICLKLCRIVLHQFPNDKFLKYLTGTLQCPNSSLNASSSKQRFSNVPLWSTSCCHWKPIFSNRSILSCERLRCGFRPPWSFLYIVLILLHQFANDLFLEYTTGTLQKFPNSSLNALRSKQCVSNAPSWSTACYWKLMFSNRSITSCERLTFDFLPSLIFLYADRMLLHHFASDAFLEYLRGTLQCPFASLN